jgi:hypothetical protein
VSHPNPDTGELESMFGPDSIAESGRQVAVERLYGADALGRYIQLRHVQPQGDPLAVAGALGFDTAALTRQADSEETSRVLRSHAERSTRFRVTGTPTLYVNNLEYAGDMETPALLRTLCWELPEALRGEPCRGVPECTHNGHCRKQPGKIGICVDAGNPDAHCEYRDPPPLKLLVLTSGDVQLTNPRALVGDLRSLLPGLVPENVTYGSDVGHQLATLGKVRWLPAFFFPTGELEQRPNLADLAQGLTKLGDYYMVLPEHTPAGLDITRERRPGQVDLFYRPYLPAALDAVTAMLSVFGRPEVSARVKLELHALLMRGPKGELSAEGGVAEIEEAARQAVIWRDHPDAMLRYIALRRQAGNSSYWDVPVRMAGLDPDEVRKAAIDRPALDRLYADARMREDLGVWGECILLSANQELADISAPGRANEVADRLGLAPSSVTLLFTGSANGQLEACHCPGNPYGGLSRQAGAVSELRDLYRASVLVDTGNVFPERPDQTRFTYQLRALDSFRYDAVAIGDQDFAYGTEILRGLATASGVAFVSSNMTLPGVEPRTVLLDRGGAKVGVISLTSPRAFAFREGGVPAGVTIADPVETARRLVPELRTKCSAVVALFHGYLEDARGLATAVPELNAVVCGHEGVALQAPEQVGTTWLLAPGRNGEWVGRLTFRLDETGAAIGAESQMIAMDDLIVPEPAVEKIIADYESEVQGAMQVALNAAKVDEASKPESCAQCHQPEYARWKSTKHATAAATLRALQREFDPDCWNCHSSPPLAADAARLPDVSCVACHRMPAPGPTGHKALEPLTAKSCLPCHTEGKSPHFDPATYMPRVAHLAPAG